MRSFAVVVLFGLAATPAAQAKRPNIVLILADDLGIGDLGCYNPESKIPTPNMDRIAGQGMRFTDMHSPSAVCTPTRYALLTGRYAWRSRLKRGVLQGYSPALLEPGRLTLASFLKAKGYATACIGKWHLGLGSGKRTDYSKPLVPGPRNAGFEWFRGIPASLDMPPYVWVENERVAAPPTRQVAKSAHRRQQGGGFWRAGAIAPDFRHEDVLPTIGRQAADWIGHRARQTKPFFLYVALTAPHTPWLPSREFRGRSKAGYYGDFVAMVDAVVGEIDAAIDRAELGRETLLLVTSDNGSHWPRADIEKWGHRANLAYRGQKADIWEGGHRVPFLARWPGKTEPRSISRETACLTDMLATFAGILNEPLPDDAGEDSFDLSGILQGETGTRPLRPVTVHHSVNGTFALRKGDLKLILGRGSGGFTRPRTIPPQDLKPGDPRGQLYDLAADPGETRNLWNDRPALVAELRRMLDGARRRGRTAPRRAGWIAGRASGGPLLPEQAAFDVRHYDLALAVDPRERGIDGVLRMRAKMLTAADRLVLHLDDHLQVRRVMQGMRALEHVHENGLVRMRLPRTVPAGHELTVSVAYGGKPRVAPRPPWDGGFTWKTSKDGSPWIATSSQGEGADLWWPCKDHPSDKPETMDLRVTVPGNLVCASNGVLKSDQRNADGTRTFHWEIRNPISNYNVALNIGPYEVVTDEYASVDGTKVPVFFYCLPESRAKAEQALPHFLEHLRFFERLFGPYPFRNEKYGIAETPHLGMEHQTIIAYGNKFRRQQWDYDWLHHHELSHEWWGNLVTCRDWKDMWIHEGFGTYTQILWIEQEHGPKAMRVELERRRRSIVNRRPVAPLETTDSKGIYFGARGRFDNDIYYKGAWILHTLRYVVGDEAFFRTLRLFCYPTKEMERVTDGSQVRFVDTEDFRALVERISGQDLSWFFEVYLRQPRLPRLVHELRDGTLHLRWEVPGKRAFPMPVPVRVGDEVQRVPMPAEHGTIRVAADHAIDPDRWILRHR